MNWKDEIKKADWDIPLMIGVIEQCINYANKKERQGKGDTFTFYVRPNLETIKQFLEEQERLQ